MPAVLQQALRQLVADVDLPQEALRFVIHQPQRGCTDPALGEVAGVAHVVKMGQQVAAAGVNEGISGAAGKVAVFVICLCVGSKVGFAGMDQAEHGEHLTVVG